MRTHYPLPYDYRRSRRCGHWLLASHRRVRSCMIYWRTRPTIGTAEVNDSIYYIRYVRIYFKYVRFCVCLMYYVNNSICLYIHYMYRQDRLRALRFLDSVIAAPGNPSLIYSYAPIHLLFYIYANHASYYLYTIHMLVCM